MLGKEILKKNQKAPKRNVNVNVNILEEIVLEYQILFALNFLFFFFLDCGSVHTFFIKLNCQLVQN